MLVYFVLLGVTCSPYTLANEYVWNNCFLHMVFACLSVPLSSSVGIIGVSRVPPEQLEPAIVRPGRFDKWIKLERDEKRFS